MRCEGQKSGSQFRGPVAAIVGIAIVLCETGTAAAWDDYCGPPTAQQRANRTLIGVLPPQQVLDFGPPPSDFDEGYCNPTFGINVYRLSKQEEIGGGTWIANSERTAFNSTDEYFYAERNGWCVLYSSQGQEVHDFRTEKLKAGDMRFAKTLPYTLLWKNGEDLSFCDYSAYLGGGSGPLSCKPVGTVPGDWAGGDGNDITDDDRYLVLNQGGAARVVDLTSGSVVYEKAFPGSQLDYATMSSTGKYVLAYLTAPDRFTYYLDWKSGGDWEIVVPWMVHAEVGTNDNGDDILYMAVELGSHSTLGNYAQWANANLPHSPQVTVGGDDIVAINLSQSRFMTPLFRLAPKGSYVHLTYNVPLRNTRHLFVSTLRQECPTAASLADWMVYEGEILEIPIDGSAYTQVEAGTLPFGRRLVHTYSTTCAGSTPMQAQADLAVNSTATQVVYRASVQTSQADLYMFFVPQEGPENDAGGWDSTSELGLSDGVVDSVGVDQEGPKSDGSWTEAASGESSVSGSGDRGESCGCRVGGRRSPVSHFSLGVLLLLLWRKALRQGAQ